MLNFIIKRVVQLFIVFFIALILIFFIPRLLPGDPARFIIGERVQTGGMYLNVTRVLSERFGLNKSYPEQFLLFLLNTFQGYLGVSWSYFPREVSAVILDRLPWTLFIMIPARIFSFILAYFVGVLAAWKKGGKLDVALQFLGLMSIAMPIFWVGSVILMIFSYYIPIFPRGGSLTPGLRYETIWTWAFWSDALYHAALPIIILSLFGFFGEALLMRNTMLWVLNEDFILTAEAKGLPERTIMFKHAARNAMLPLVTNFFMGLGFMITGSIFVETVFAYPGMGQLMTRAIFSRDFPLVQGIFIIMTSIVLLSNLIADILYMWLDPRIKFTAR